MAKDLDFYKKMLEAKKAKKAALEAKRLRDEFELHPERFQANLPPIIVKTDAEIKMDQAFGQLKARLRENDPNYQAKLDKAIKDAQIRAEGF